MKNRIEMKKSYNVVARVEVDGLGGKAESAGLHSSGVECVEQSILIACCHTQFVLCHFLGCQ
jgi:hypothetical protein